MPVANSAGQPPAETNIVAANSSPTSWLMNTKGAPERSIVPPSIQTSSAALASVVLTLRVRCLLAKREGNTGNSDERGERYRPPAQAASRVDAISCQTGGRHATIAWVP